MLTDYCSSVNLPLMLLICFQLPKKKKKHTTRLHNEKHEILELFIFHTEIHSRVMEQLTGSRE